MEGLPHNLAKATWQPQITVRLQDLLLNDHSNPVTFDDDVDVTQLHDFPHLGFDTYQTETEKPFTVRLSLECYLCTFR